jgi:hypothetical protein
MTYGWYLESLLNWKSGGLFKPVGSYLAVTTDDIFLFDVHDTHTDTHTGVKNKRQPEIAPQCHRSSNNLNVISELQQSSASTILVSYL